jgi:hypothetical protein
MCIRLLFASMVDFEKMKQLQNWIAVQTFGLAVQLSKHAALSEQHSGFAGCNSIFKFLSQLLDIQFPLVKAPAPGSIDFSNTNGKRPSLRKELTI